MIVFNLKCNNDHKFEGWFASSSEFEEQRQSTLLNCPVCGSNQVDKALHAPRFNTSSAAQPTVEQERKENAETYANVAREVAQMIDHVIRNTEDVGDAFPEEARRIHYKETPERKIRGNATTEEVKELRDEGIEVVALPIPKYRLGKAH